MYKIAVMGDRDSIYGFAAVGLEPFPIEDADEARMKLRELAEGNYAVIYMTEKLANELEHELQHYASNPLPAIILIPGVSGNTGKGLQAVKQSVEKAVGSDIIFGND